MAGATKANTTKEMDKMVNGELNYTGKTKLLTLNRNTNLNTNNGEQKTDDGWAAGKHTDETWWIHRRTSQTTKTEDAT